MPLALWGLPEDAVIVRPHLPRRNGSPLDPGWNAVNEPAAWVLQPHLHPRSMANRWLSIVICAYHTLSIRSKRKSDNWLEHVGLHHGQVCCFLLKRSSSLSGRVTLQTPNWSFVIQLPCHSLKSPIRAALCAIGAHSR